MLCEAELGNPMYELLSGDSGAREAAEKEGRVATFGIGRSIPEGWVDAGDVIAEELKGLQIPDPEKGLGEQKNHPNAFLQYNEYICYDVAQIRLRYLIRFQM